MTITPIHTRRIYVEIVDQLVDLIVHGQLTQGQQLPSERELTERLGVSRMSLREALIALEIMGLIETRHGQGRFVRFVDKRAPLLQFDSLLFGEESPFALLQARKILEPGAAALAARVQTEEAISRIGGALELGESNLSDVALRSKADRLFHRAIAEATQNAVIEAVMGFICELMGQKLWQALDYTAEAVVNRLLEFWVQHRAIYEAIRARDEQGASRAMLDHLEEVEKGMMA